MNGYLAPPNTLFLAVDLSNHTRGNTRIQVSENVYLLLTACRCCFGKLIPETMEGMEKGCSDTGTQHFISVYWSVQ